MKHVGYASRDVILGVESMLDSLPQLATSVKRMQEVMLEPAEQRLLAESSARLRWGAEVPVTAERLVAPRRRDDVGQDLWKTFNVIQENLVNGGIRGANATGRRMRTRAVTGVDAGVRLNRELWALAEAMGKLKRGEGIENISALA